MQYRNIAKRFIFTHGFRREIVTSDGVTFGEGKEFTPGQTEKANSARESVREQMLKKWDDCVPKKERKDVPLGVLEQDD